MDTITVEKNGIQDEMSKTVWEMIGADANKDGWRRVVSAPLEVVQIKSKKEEAKKAEETQVVIESPEGEVEKEVVEEIENEVKQTKKAAKKTGKKK